MVNRGVGDQTLPQPRNPHDERRARAIGVRERIQMRSPHRPTSRPPAATIRLSLLLTSFLAAIQPHAGLGASRTVVRTLLNTHLLCDR